MYHKSITYYIPKIIVKIFEILWRFDVILREESRGEESLLVLLTTRGRNK